MTIGFFGGLSVAGLVLLGIGVVADEDQPRRIGGPSEVAGAALARGEPARLAALAAEDPDLPAGGLVVVAALPARHERDPLAVGAEARLRFARRAGRQADVLGAGPVRQPDVAFVLVAGDVGEPHGVGDPGAVGRDVEIAHVTEAVDVGDLHRPPGTILAGQSDGGQGERQGVAAIACSGERNRMRGPRKTAKSCHGCAFG